MSAADIFEAWEEHIVSHEKGNRIVHYYMKKHSSGDLVLAVRGYERSIRHMMYVVSDDFLHNYGSITSINMGTKWRARRQVVDWLTSLVSNTSPLSSNEPVKMAQSVGSRGFSKGGFSKSRMHKQDQTIQVPRNFKIEHSEMEWSGDAWVCYKQLNHYSAFRRNGIIIAVHAFVFIMAEEGSDHLGYLEDLYEDKKGRKRAKVRLFHQSKEVNAVNPHPREVIITPHVQVISAECIGGTATVLTPKHYEKCLPVVGGIHMCFRQLKNNNIEPFFVSKLRGYSNQSIFSSLEISKHKTERSCLDSGNQMVKSEKTFKKLKIKLKRKRPVGDGSEPQHEAASFFKVNDNIEVLCQDSGIRGCWFRCKVLQISQKKRLKVQYNDVLDVDGSRNLEEWIPACRVANPDKLGMRISGRLTIRPCHLPEDSSSDSLKVGDAVDAWWSDGWWEGVVTEVVVVTTSESDSFHVYLLGEERWLTLERKYIRTSRDWVDNRWVNVQPNTDVVLSLVSSLKSQGRTAPIEPQNIQQMLNLKKRLRVSFENEVGSGL